MMKGQTMNELQHDWTAPPHRLWLPPGGGPRLTAFKTGRRSGSVTFTRPAPVSSAREDHANDQ